MKCKACGMERGEHDRACVQEQLHRQKLEIVKKLVAWKKQYEPGSPGDVTINKMCEVVIDTAIRKVQEA